MTYNTNITDVELIYVIVNFGMGSKIFKTAKSYGILGGTITLARGTANNQLWNYLGLSDIRKEVLYMVADRETASKALEGINSTYQLDKPNHGIAFTTSIGTAIGLRMAEEVEGENERGERERMYQIITTIVDKGRAEFVIEAASRAGSKGGTIINARGSGIHETSKLFSMEIEPEKEIVIILSEEEYTEAIAEEIRKDLDIDKPGKGIIYIQDVNRAYGLRK